MKALHLLNHKRNLAKGPWMSHTAGEPLLVGVIIGGHLADGSATYVVKVNDNNEFVVLDYFATKSALAYYEDYGVHTATSMEILVMVKGLVYTF